MRLPEPCLALVTDRRLVAGRLEATIARALDGGVDLVQLREKDLPAGELLRLAERVRRLSEGRALLVVNDRLDVALAAGADGVHLPEAGLPLAAARHVVGDRLIIGRSVHSVDGALAAAGADYLQIGTIYATGSKPGVVPAGPQLISAVASRVPARLLAIGGIDAGKVAAVVEAGASGVAVMSAILAAPDPAAAADGLRRALLAAWQEQEVTR